jgi:type IV pilus assembly protein PilV
MKTLNTVSKKTASGLTLIEVLVTIVITSIGLMGLISLQMQALKATQDAGNYSHATWVLNDLTSRIKANRESSLSYVAAGPVICPANSTTLPAGIVVCSNYATGSARVGSAVCTGPELAAWDLFEVACGLPRDNNNIIGNPIDALPSLPGLLWGPTLMVRCVIAGCTNLDQLQLTLTWRARVDAIEATEASAAIRQNPDNLLQATRLINP